ncbi:hypothetical protein GV819_23740 [Pseudomonas sp. Fl5BN2]|uniref:hypothetical protein n=1 Tax=Pseudomonas sp. Fl5BN2 TaxID=2697652 RepID=UPI001378EA79|nr:hypothetical protein [Pseudomonas sp. Fl5BN2]NBF05306.1 hypothetical protein [Pseudomonas sp. Fl5BN2]
MAESFDALIVPADNSPSDVAIKKAILFFDSVTLVNPVDRALVNNMEVIEKFPNGMSVGWANRNDFPRTPDYLDGMERILSDTSSLRSRGVVRLTPAGPLPTLDAGMNYLIWHSAITSASLIEAAAPDRYQQSKPPLGISGYMLGGVLSVKNFKSKYEMIETRPPARFSDVDDEWSIFATLRLGRALKFLRLSNALGLTPLAFDLPNQRILNASAEFGSLLTQHQSVEVEFSQGPMQLDFDILEPVEFQSVLKEMSWNEVQKLRKYILPGMNNLRAYLKRSIQLQGKASSLEPDTYQKALVNLNLEFRVAKEKLATEWEKLRIAAICKVGLGAVGGAYLANGTGLIATVVGVPWVDTLTKMFGAGLVATSTLSSELQALVPARRIVKQHPLYFTDKLPGETR